MDQPAPSSEPTSNDATPAPGRHDQAVEAMLAGIEQLDALGLEGVEPAAAFLWT
jgi:hypothetical protein